MLRHFQTTMVASLPTSTPHPSSLRHAAVLTPTGATLRTALASAVPVVTLLHILYVLRYTGWKSLWTCIDHIQKKEPILKTSFCPVQYASLLTIPRQTKCHKQTGEYAV